MRVVAMSMLTGSRYISYLIMFCLAIFGGKNEFIPYLIVLINFYIFYVHIASIPLMLNWSRNLYLHIFKSIFSSIVLCVLTFSIVYYLQGLNFNENAIYSIKKSIYFSLSMFTNLGYGGVHPLEINQLISSLEALIGILYLPLLTAYIWIYVQDRLWEKGHDEKQEFESINLIDTVYGVSLALEDESKTQKRTKKFKLKTCSKCDDGDLSILKYYDTIGRVTPLSKFIVKCECGNISKPKNNTFLATISWNKNNKSR